MNPETLRLLIGPNEDEFAADAWLLIPAAADAWEDDGINYRTRIVELEAELNGLRKRLEAAERNHIVRKHIDATPDDGYPLRILRVYRADCDMLWAGSSDGDTDTPLTVALNKMQKQRAAILDKAIAALAGEET